MDLLNRLAKFYKTESQGLPHYEDELVNLAYDLAAFVEDLGEEEDGEWWWEGNICKDSERLAEQLQSLRMNPTSTAIDTIVNHMHQGLLDEIDRSGGEAEAMMAIGGDIAEYLLARN